MAKAPKIVKEEPLETQLRKAADKFRKNIDAAEYKHVVLGLIFLKYISDAFAEMFAKLQSGDSEYAGADPEDKDEYQAENIFFVPAEARGIGQLFCYYNSELESISKIERGKSFQRWSNPLSLQHQCGFGGGLQYRTGTGNRHGIDQAIPGGDTAGRVALR